MMYFAKALLVVIAVAILLKILMEVCCFTEIIDGYF